MILSQQLLRGFKKNKGCIVNIASVTAQQSNPHGCAYGAVKAGSCQLFCAVFLTRHGNTACGWRWYPRI